MGDLLIKWFCSKPSDNPLCKTYRSLANDGAGAYYNRGLALMDKGCSDKVMADYIRAIELDPKDLDVGMKGPTPENDGQITDEELDLYYKKLDHEAAQLGLSFWADYSLRRKIQDATNMLKSILGRQGLIRESDEYRKKIALGLYYFAEMPAKKDLGNEAESPSMKRIERSLKKNGLAEFWNYLKIAGGPGSRQSVEE